MSVINLVYNRDKYIIISTTSAAMACQVQENFKLNHGSADRYIYTISFEPIFFWHRILETRTLKYLEVFFRQNTFIQDFMYIKFRHFLPPDFSCFLSRNI